MTVSDEKLDAELIPILGELITNLRIQARELAIAQGVSTSVLSDTEKRAIDDIFWELCTRCVYQLMHCSEFEAAFDFFRMKETENK